MDHCAEFGHRHLSIFYRRLMTVAPGGIRCEGQWRTGQDIAGIKVWQETWPGIGHQAAQKLLPRARITWTDGRSTLLRGDALVKRRHALSPGFASAFDELVCHLQALHRACHLLKQGSGPHAAQYAHQIKVPGE